MTTVPRLSEACWLVTNGDRTVGPVHMSALLDGLDRGSVSAECLVRQPDWPEWRALSQTREYRALHGTIPVHSEDLSRKLSDLLAAASDRTEVVHCALQATMLATQAAFGWGHRRAGKRGEFMTMCRRGPVPDRLGQNALVATDPVLLRARQGEVIAGAASAGDAESAIARRFENAQAQGVAMVPIFEPNDLWGVVEVGRTDHAFRRSDRRLLAMIAHSARQRLSS